jgi:molecular chaperone HscB
MARRLKFDTREVAKILTNKGYFTTIISAPSPFKQVNSHKLFNNTHDQRWKSGAVLLNDQTASQLSSHDDHDHSHSHNNAHHKWAECWSCGTSVQEEDLFCHAPKCGVVQVLQTKESNIFATFALPISYDIDEHGLDMAFKKLQMKLHPDKFATKSSNERSVSNQSSAAVNYSYQTLKSPVHRAEYLVWLLFRRKIFEETQMNQDQSFILEMFEWRENAEDAKGDKKKTTAITEKITAEFKKLQKQFSQSIGKKDENTAVQSATRLKYFSKVSRLIKMKHCILGTNTLVIMIL